ncbi:MAG TPA: chemotaxis protein CheW [Acetobacteraceae bacterium]|nr:chemotaxis protein CheW [Acetobacteraceae bacterium]
MTHTVEAGAAPARAAEEQQLTVTVAGQSCCVPVLAIRDVLRAQAITRIPLAAPEIAGSLNLRGRIVTAIDLRARLGLPRDVPAHRLMSVVIEQGAELYSLLVDEVGEVVDLPAGAVLPNPPTLDAGWHRVSAGVWRDEGRLVVLLDVERLLDLG